MTRSPTVSARMIAMSSGVVEMTVRRSAGRDGVARQAVGD